MDKQIKLEIEELEERIAPARLVVDPPGAGIPGGHFPREIAGDAAANHADLPDNPAVTIG